MLEFGKRIALPPSYDRCQPASRKPPHDEKSDVPNDERKSVFSEESPSVSCYTECIGSRPVLQVTVALRAPGPQRLPPAGCYHIQWQTKPTESIRETGSIVQAWRTRITEDEPLSLASHRGFPHS